MKTSATLTLLFFMLCEAGFAMIYPTRLTCEYLNDPMAIDILNPRLSWINIESGKTRNQFQTAWQIMVSTNLDSLHQGKGDLWNSGKVISDETINIIYNGKPLASRQECWWIVRVWDKDGVVSEWSEPAYWAMGILNREEWVAKWIGAPWQGEDPIPDHERPLTSSRAKQGQIISDIATLKAPPPAPMLRKKIHIEKEIVSAHAFVTGLGYFELYLNGKKAGVDVLVPNQTNYGKRPGLENNPIPIEDNFREYRVMYLVYDIKGLLNKGDNVIGAIIGNGFYNAPINWTESYGTPRFLGQIYIKYIDGTEDVIISDQTWKAAKSPIVMDLVFDGEHYDARLEQPGWCNPDFDDSHWEQAALRRAPEGVLKAQMSPPDRVMERFKPYKIDRISEGHYRVDFGQEISGWVHLTGIIGEEGRKIDIKYIHNTPSGDNSYTLKGSGLEFYSARFTWFVFREVEIINWPGELKPGNIKAEAVYSNIETTGKFECSNELLNKINKIWWRSQTDNMHGGIASDCPNRERSPYTGDGQVACVTVMHNFDARSFYTKWIQDIVGAQNITTGYVPNGAPWQPGCGGGVAWGAAVSIMPWEFYLHYADTNILSATYEGMKGYVRYMLTWVDSTGIMYSQVPSPDGKPNRWMNLGDWSQPYELPPDDMVHTFYLWRCADLTAKTAKVLGETSEYEEYILLAEKTRDAFHNRFYDNEKGTYGKYGGNIFALKMGVPDSQKDRVVSALKDDIIANGGHLDTGIFGTQFFFEVLTENGLHELAYQAMNKKSAPGYGYWLEQGATTSWEGWTDPGSGNHPMFGGGLVWLYRKLAGMNTDPEHPGYRRIIFCPEPVNDISSARYSNLTPFGMASISWEKRDSKFITKIEVPVGSTAIVHIPATEPESIRESGKKIKRNSEIKNIGFRDGFAVYSVGSGMYEFESDITVSIP